MNKFIDRPKARFSDYASCVISLREVHKYIREVSMIPPESVIKLRKYFGITGTMSNTEIESISNYLALPENTESVLNMTIDDAVGMPEVNNLYDVIRSRFILAESIYSSIVFDIDRCRKLEATGDYPSDKQITLLLSSRRDMIGSINTLRERAIEALARVESI